MNKDERTILRLHGFDPGRNERVRELSLVRYPRHPVKVWFVDVVVDRVALEVVWAED